MSILDPGVIDAVALRSDGEVVTLVIDDPLRWDDLGRHRQLLDDKISAYLGFLDAGRLGPLLGSPGVGEGGGEPSVRIVLAVRHPPTPEAQRVLEEVRVYLSRAGIPFSVS